MSTALTTISPDTGQPILCGECGARLICGYCSTGDVLQDARRAIAEVIKSKDPGRNAMARVSAAKIVLAKDFLAYLSDEDLLAEVRRRGEETKKAKGAER